MRDSLPRFVARFSTHLFWRLFFLSSRSLQWLNDFIVSAWRATWSYSLWTIALFFSLFLLQSVTEKLNHRTLVRNYSCKKELGHLSGTYSCKKELDRLYLQRCSRMSVHAFISIFWSTEPLRLILWPS
jgi:hypothetical protein